MLFFYFYLISFSLIGYGLLANKVLSINANNIGYLGLLGISVLTILSYASSIFISHGYVFNLVLIIFGIVLFVIFFKNITNMKKELTYYLFTFLILSIFILVGKNHDDFSYYHFPYMYLLTEFSHPLGIGQLNNGFRNPSSLFFLSSIFYLPKINFYLFHITPAFFLGFANLFLIKYIFDKNIFKSAKFINFLSLILFIFINIFFYRLSEHGTDRSGLILSICLIIILLDIINRTQNPYEIKDNIKLFSIISCLLISLKPFYLIYTVFFIILFLNEKTKKITLNLFFSKTFLYCLFFIFFVFFYTFINSGCLVFPANFTCFYDLKWSFSPEVIEDVRIWYELWSKGGATPHNVVEDRNLYISGMNWLPNWIEVYFFNKVSDFILGLLILLLIFSFSFLINKNKKTLKDKTNYKYLSVYIIIIFCLIEWFLYHPTLRYGGYHLFALILYIPLSIFISRFNFQIEFFYKRAFLLILITIVVFFSRNISRLSYEYKVYSYNPLLNTKYQFHGGDKKFHFRYSTQMKKNILKYQKISFLGKEFLITKIKN